MTDPHLTPEREADPMRDALEASTELMAQAVVYLRMAWVALDIAEAIDDRVVENQRVLGLAVAEADKPHDGNER